MNTESKQNQPIDQQALNLTHAIALQESGKNGKPNYDAVGDNGTSHGAYQWQPGNFESAAKEAGLDPTDLSPENQDKVAYYQVKKYKDEGYQPAQIASLWNSGSPDNWQNHSGTTVINGKSISYDTPAYVQGVKSYYNELSGNQNTSSGNNNQQPSSTGTPTSDDQGYITSANLPIIPDQQQRQQLESAGQPISINPDKSQPSFVGGLIRDTVTPFARAATNLIHAGQIVSGHTLTEPLSNSYLGNVSSIGTNPNKTFGGNLLDALGSGVSIAGTLEGADAGVGALGGLLKGTDVLASPAVETAMKGFNIPMEEFNGLSNAEKLNALTEASKTATATNKIVLQQAIDKVTPAAVKEAGGVVKFSKLYPGTAKALGLLKSGAKLAGAGILGIAGLGEGKKILGGLIK